MESFVVLLKYEESYSGASSFHPKYAYSLGNLSGVFLCAYSSVDLGISFESSAAGVVDYIPGPAFVGYLSPSL